MRLDQRVLRFGRIMLKGDRTDELGKLVEVSQRHDPVGGNAKPLEPFRIAAFAAQVDPVVGIALFLRAVAVGSIGRKQEKRIFGRGL